MRLVKFSFLVVSSVFFLAGCGSSATPAAAVNPNQNHYPNGVNPQQYAGQPGQQNYGGAGYANNGAGGYGGYSANPYQTGYGNSGYGGYGNGAYGYNNDPSYCNTCGGGGFGFGFGIGVGNYGYYGSVVSN